MKAYLAILFILLTGCTANPNHHKSGKFSFVEYQPQKWHIEYKSKVADSQDRANQALAIKASQLCKNGYTETPEFNYFEVQSSTPAQVRKQAELLRKFKWYSLWVRCN